MMGRMKFNAEQCDKCLETCSFPRVGKARSADSIRDTETVSRTLPLLCWQFIGNLSIIVPSLV